MIVPYQIRNTTMVNYRDAVANEVTQAKENSASNNDETQREQLEQIEVDMGETPFVKFYPTVALTGTFPEDEGNPIIRFRDEQNNGHGHQGYLGLVLDDLSVDQSEAESDADFDMSEATIIETDDDDYTEYRAVNFGDDNTTEKFGGEAVNIDGDQYGVEDRVSEIDGRVILVVDRTAARSVAQKLDVNGATYADMDEATGEPNTGLIEFAPDGGGEVENFDGTLSWRYARRPELREELLGEDVTTLVSRREEVDAGGTGYIGENGQHDEPVVGFGDDEQTHTDPTQATYEELTEAVLNGKPEARPMMWYSVFDGEGQSLDPVEGETTGYSFLEWNFDPTANHLPDEQWEFVQEYQAQGLPTDEETITENVEGNFENANTERIVALIQNGAGEEQTA